MFTVPELAAEALCSFLAADMSRRFGSIQAGLIEHTSTAAQLALECIGDSDALYHNVEHTMLVTLAGYDIMKGRSLLRPTLASDCAHVIVACLFHDIGYVRGILNGDDAECYVIDANGKTVELPRGSSDAALLPYRVDRSKLYVLNRFAGHDLIDAERIADAIEYTRFPLPAGRDNTGNEECRLVLAADLIGQIADPHYLRKTNALWREFKEAGVDKQLGLTSPADLTNLYPQFYWESISPHIQVAIRYLNITSSGRLWLAGLYSNVFRAKRDPELCEPQLAGS
jgi:hypothetical protein